MGYVFEDASQSAAAPAPQPTKGYVFESDTPPVVPPKQTDLIDAIAGTAQKLGASINAGAAGLYRKAFGTRSENFERNAKWWRDKAAANGITNDSVYGKVIEGVGSVPASLPEWLPTPAGLALGTALNASGGYQDAKDHGTNPFVGAVKGAAKHLLFRGAFKVIDAIPVAKMLPETMSNTSRGVVDVGAKATTMGSLMAGETALEGGDAKDVTASFIIGAGLPVASHMMAGGKLSEVLKEQGVPEEVATNLEQKGNEIDTSDPRNMDVFTDQVNDVIDTQRQAEAVREEPVVAPEPPVEEPPVEPPPVVNADPVPYEVTPEERIAAEAQAKALFNENGEYIGATKPPDSLLNLERVSTDDAENLAVLFARGEMLRDKVKERLGAESGTEDEILRKLDEVLLKQVGKETGIDLLEESATTTAQMEDIRIAAIKTRYMLDKFTKEAFEAGKIADSPEATPEQIAFAEWKKNLAEQFYARSVEQGRLASWILNDRKIIPDIETVLGIKDVTFEDFVANPGLVDGVMKGIEANGGIAKARKEINDYLKAGDLEARIGKIKKKDKSGIMNTIFEFSSFNMLSSIYGRAKDLFHNIFRPFADDLETAGAAIGSGGKGVTFREAGYQIYGDIQGTLEFLTKGWEGAKHIPHPSLREAFSSPIETLYQSIENFESFIDQAGFMHGKTKATLEGLNRRYVSRRYIETTGTGKAFSAFLEGLGKAVNVGDSVKDITYKLIDLHGMVGRSLVFGAMKLTDMPSEYMGYNAKAYGLAARETVARGLQGQEAAQAIEQMVTQAKAIRDDIKLPDETTRQYRVEAKRIHDESMKYALERTLKQELEGDWAKSLEGFVNHTPFGKGLKVVAGQYFSTPVRLLKYETDRNALGFLLSKNMRESLKGARGKEAQALATAKIVFGTLAQTTAAYLITNGVITLMAPSKERKSWRDAGVLEVALNLNGRLYKLSALEPFGNFISSVAAIYSGVTQARNEDSSGLWEITKAMIHDRTQRSYLKSLFDLKSIADGDDKAFQRFMIGQGQKLIPYSGLISSATDMYGNGEVRATDGVGDVIAKVYNPSSLDIEPDLYGKPRTTTDRFFGVPTSVPYKDGSVRSEIVRLGIDMPEAPKVLPLELSNYTKYSFPMSPLDQRDYLRSLANAPINMEENLQKVVNSPGYRTAPPREQQRLLQDIITLSHGLAKDMQYKRPEVLAAAKEQGVAVKEWYSDKSPIPTHDNWMEFLTNRKSYERKIMNKHGLHAQEGR